MAIKIEKTKLAKLNFMSTTTVAYIKPEVDELSIQKIWQFGVVDERVITISGLSEIEADTSGFWRSMFNFGKLILRADGDVVESIGWVKNPHYYQQILTQIKENQNAKRN